MKHLIFGAAILVASAAYGQKTNFSGSYKVNEEKVNWGAAPKFILPRYIKVNQLKDRIVITRTTLNQNLEEQPPMTDTILFNGTENSRTTTSGKTVQNLKWSDDKSFVLVRKNLDAQGTVIASAVETWNMENAGKTLFINRDVDANIKYTTKAYFEKQ